MAVERAAGGESPGPVPPFLARAVRYLRWLAPGHHDAVLEVAYRAILGRAPDAAGRALYLPKLRDGELNVEKLGRILVDSPEFHLQSLAGGLGPYLHRSRCAFVRSLPPARRILDLGGTDLGHEHGALVTMGYPYRFDELVIVDLPHGERHPLYDKGPAREAGEVATPRGPVRYAFHSMVDLSAYPEASFDLVFSGESIEHLPAADARTMLEGAFRVLRPGGRLALDTPNARVTRLQQAEFIDPDHEHEYTVEEMGELLCAAGFSILERKGMNLAADGLASGAFDPAEVARNVGIFWDAASCYLMAFVCTKP